MKTTDYEQSPKGVPLSTLVENSTLYCYMCVSLWTLDTEQTHHLISNGNCRPRKSVRHFPHNSFLRVANPGTIDQPLLFLALSPFSM